MRTSRRTKSMPVCWHHCGQPISCRKSGCRIRIPSAGADWWHAVVRHRTRIKNEVHAILHAHLIPPCPHADLFGRLGRIWLAQQLMPDDEGAAIERHLRELDRLSEDLGVLDTQIADRKR